MTDPVIPPDKIVRYLLNPDHEDGGPKARFFIGGGFSLERPEESAEALRRHFVENPPTAKTPDRFGGQRITVEAAMTVPDGRAPIVLSVWAIDQGETVPRFITAYPAD